MAETKTETKATPTKAAAANPLPSAPQDRVAMVSLNKDGTADQTPGYTFVGDKESAIAAAKTQFAQQAASAVDEAERTPGVPIGEEAGGVGSTEPDANVQALKEKIEAAASAAEKSAESLVSARFTE